MDNHMDRLESTLLRIATALEKTATITAEVLKHWELATERSNAQHRLWMTYEYPIIEARFIMFMNEGAKVD
jgi:hypothetical protein